MCPGSGQHKGHGRHSARKGCQNEHSRACQQAVVQKQHHHQRHRQEEIGQGGKGVLYRQSGGIASPQSDGPQHHQQAAGPGLPLPGTGAVEQFHRTGPEQPEQVPHQRQQEEEAEESGGIGHAGKADLKAILHRQVGQLQ